jgi:regulator of protease activity HflC (stomatin/prohibitin superfamily)
MIYIYVVGAVLAMTFLFLVSGIRIIKEYERGVVFRLGRYVGTRGPGIIFVIPVIETMDRVSLRIITLDVPVQEIMTYDNVPVEVNAVVYYRIKNPEDAIIQVNDYHMATSQIAQTTLRSVLGQAELDELLAEREKINQQLQSIIDEETNPWGIKVSSVEVKNVELPQSMQRAMARQAEAERERRAKIIAAEGESQAAAKLNEAAEVIGQTSTGIQLRFLQTLTEISSEGTNTVVFPLPIDMLPDMDEVMEVLTPDGDDGDGDGGSGDGTTPETDVDVPGDAGGEIGNHVPGADVDLNADVDQPDPDELVDEIGEEDESDEAEQDRDASEQNRDEQ